jgi:hypothetical protein
VGEQAETMTPTARTATIAPIEFFSMVVLLGFTAKNEH